MRVCSMMIGVLVAMPLMAEEPELVRVFLKNASSHVGTVVDESDFSITISDIKNNKDVTVSKRDTIRIGRSLTLNEAVRATDAETVCAWQISKLTGDGTPILSKIARVTPQVVYITMGASNGASVGQELSVFRNKGEIIDPDSGEVLAIERPLISKLKVVEVKEKFCKAKIQSDVEVELLVGDIVEAKPKELVVAVCPIALDNGAVTNIGAGLSEDVTTSLVQRGVKVVDRSTLSDVLGELLIQNTSLFKTESAQKLGKLTGATKVLTGKIVPQRKLGQVYLRLIDVQTGEIEFAVSDSVSLVNAILISGKLPAGMKSSSNSGLSGGATNLGTGRTLPRFLTPQARYQRHEGGIRLQGDKEFTLRKTTTIRTKSMDLLEKDFTFQVQFKFEPGQKIAYIGLGMGIPDRSYNGYTDSIYLRFHAPDHAEGLVDVTGFRHDHDTMGKVRHDGTHKVTIVKEGDTVTFLVDPSSDGKSDDDLELTIPDIRKHADFFNSKNMPVFFGGSGIYTQTAFKIGEANYPGQKE